MPNQPSPFKTQINLRILKADKRELDRIVKAYGGSVSELITALIHAEFERRGIKASSDSKPVEADDTESTTK